MCRHLVVLLLPAIIQADNRIIGGYESPITDVPYQASLQLRGHHICGASIISKLKALSAAHCFPTKGSYYIKAGISSLEEEGVVVFVKQALIHPNYDSRYTKYDISIVDLATPLIYSEKIQPVALPCSGDQNGIRERMVGKVSGWGTTDANHKEVGSNQLRSIELPVWSWEKCYNVYYRQLSSLQFCAGYEEGGKDACQGDSGGPFVVNGVIYGITSSGTGCAERGFPGIFTDVQLLRDFITEYAGM